MKEYVIEGWQDYWNMFDALIVSLEASNQKDIAFAIKDAQKYFNKLTDGYYEFLTAFEKSITVYRNNFIDEQKNIADFLIKTLKKQDGEIKLICPSIFRPLTPSPPLNPRNPRKDEL